MSRASEIKAAAYHEGGHATAWWAMGGKLESIQIDRNGGGLCRGKESWGILGPTSNNRDNAIPGLIAGPMAERQAYSRFSRPSFERTFAHGAGNPVSDGERVKELLGKDSLDKWVRQTWRIIRDHDRRIKDLAEALLDRWKISGDEAMQILNGRR